MVDLTKYTLNFTDNFIVLLSKSFSEASKNKILLEYAYF
ncbi:hypothetical protein C723_1371 [Christiangramia flava JLT2011]|uniref:Uncharacterized protein n=1 Tax=Christiangramia flava JLT2011 TaxID=1229726 RepID=A0A1L7I9U0_9FLAO|nr:hypothetical protein GRFL_3260 [Christiangramia flava JLT2011]OSS39469.1 hypothetical protein C723_1371 [Christiangramia flava JLT2011]